MMRPPPSQLALFALLALLGGERCAHAANPTPGGGAMMQAAPGANATGSDINNPAISNPQEPEADCYVAAAGEARVAPDPKNPAKPRVPCMSQQDALKRSAEAASYLAFYQQNFSDYGVKMRDPEQRKAIQSDIAACLGNDQSCNDKTADPDHNAAAKLMQNHLLQALVQYNFGKDVRRMFLESETRAENMRTLDLPPQELRALGMTPDNIVRKMDKDRSTIQSQSIRTSSFKLNPHDTQLMNFEDAKLSPEQRAALGPEFNRNFDSFVNEYTSSSGQRGPKSQWNYVAVKMSAVGGQVPVIGRVNPPQKGEENNLRIGDARRLEYDTKSQKNKVVEEIVDSYRKGYSDVVKNPTTEITVTDYTDPTGQTFYKKKVDSMAEAYHAAGFGLPQAEIDMVHAADPNAKNVGQQVAAAQVIRINKAIYDSETKLAKGSSVNDQGLEMQRTPSSAGPNASTPAGQAAKVIPSVTVDIDKFTTFLDDIWPAGAPRPN